MKTIGLSMYRKLTGQSQSNDCIVYSYEVKREGIKKKKEKLRSKRILPEIQE